MPQLTLKNLRLHLHAVPVAAAEFDEPVSVGGEELMAANELPLPFPRISDGCGVWWRGPSLPEPLASLFRSTFQSQDQHASTDHHYAQPFTNRWPLVKEQHCEDGHEHKAEFVDGGHLRRVTNLQSPEVADP
jgi:hypothetical protein